MNDYSVKTDSDLVKLTLCGNSKAYEELVVRHERAVKGTAMKVTGNEYSATDASQDAFVSAWMHLDALREHDKFRSWVCSIAKNHARRLHAHYCAAVPDIRLHLLENVDLSDSGEEELLGRLSLGAQAEAERDERLHEAVEALSEKIREAITLHYFEGYSVKEIAAKLSLPEGTVKWRLCEGRRQLRKEYGVMETTYNENESLVRRVMRQVEELKLWRLKNDRTGFEAAYRATLAAVESLDESTEKQYMLADVLIRGVWWLDSEKNEATLARIKESAEKSRNEEVMIGVLSNEWDGLSDGEALLKIRDEQIPYAEQMGFTKTVGCLYFWLAYHYLREHKEEEALLTFRKVLAILAPADMHYANAMAAIAMMERRQEITVTNDRHFEYSATAEVLKTIDGKLYFWAQPGFSMGWGPGLAKSLLFNCSLCDNMIVDPSMKCGEVRISSDGQTKLTFAQDGETVSTKAGVFENCKVFTITDSTTSYLTYVETVFCNGVGIVKQTSHGWDGECVWELENYKADGDGAFPLSVGNFWDYAIINNDGVIYDVINRFEVIYADGETANLSGFHFIHIKDYDDTWSGLMLNARRNYVIEHPDGTDELDSSVLDLFDRAAVLAKTPREKRHTAIAKDVMTRIIEGDPKATPDYTQYGCWNFFDPQKIAFRNGRIIVDDNDVSLSGKLSFEWKQLRIKGLSFDGWKVFYNFLYDMFSDFAEGIWSEDWVPGYHWEKKHRNYKSWGRKYDTVLDVLPDETVTVKAGTFENCRHVVIEVTPDENYRTGKKEYWYAPNVGVVKMFAYNPDGETEHCTWELTAYSGTGDGYFPVADGLFRRYEPVVLGDGYHAWVEYTFDVEGDDVILFRNACGTRDRDAHEADQREN
ncbi:MAG: sigma-70 family RNA polymerase sigma factor [Clostridia bacterium]|nr:sigma-70 family RNA polymerase sigma factor [Clostridia bacterium]